MRFTKLGKTYLDISAIGLGAMLLSLQDRPSKEKGLRVLHHTLDLGITLIDTSDAYCLDESEKHHNEKLIAKALQSYAKDTSHIVVATKGGFMRPGPGQWVPNGNPDHLRKTIRESFEALGGQKPIPLWQYHTPDPQYKIKDSMKAVKEAQDEGLIQYVGVSNFSVEQIKRAQSVIDIVSVQNQFSPWCRDPEQDGVLQYCEDEKLTFLPWSPLGGWYRFRKLRENSDLKNLASQKQTSPECLVLAWLCSKSPCVVPIPGASRTQSIEDSNHCLDISLSPEESNKINIISSKL